MQNSGINACYTQSPLWFLQDTLNCQVQYTKICYNLSYKPFCQLLFSHFTSHQLQTMKRFPVSEATQTNLTNRLTAQQSPSQVTETIVALTGSIFSVPSLGSANAVFSWVICQHLMPFFPPGTVTPRHLLESRDVFPQVLHLKGSALSPTDSFQIFLLLLDQRSLTLPKGQ